MKEELKKTLLGCKTLPSLPIVAAKVIETINQDDFGLSDVADVVRHDIAISAKLIATANSAAYRRGNGSSDVNHAISRLGVKATVMTALSFSLTAAMKDSDMVTINTDALWKRSVVSASIARLFSQQLELPNSEECFLAALIQDIGVFVLSRAVPELYEKLSDATHQEALDAELATIDCDHAEVGCWLLEQWNFPPSVAALVADSHRFAELTINAEFPQDQWCVAASGVLADAMISGDQLGLARAFSLIESVCVSFGSDCNELKSAIAATVTEAEALFETTLGPDPHELLESSKVLLFDHMMRESSDTSESRIDKLKDQVSALEQQGRLDPLTGVYNREYFDQELDRLFAAAKANQEAISLLFVDADHFKNVNDTYGHLAGDEVLKWMANTLKELVRGSDVVARFGGEEFVVILPSLTEANATRFGERVCERLRNGIVTVSDVEIRVTASIGIACAGGPSDITSARELVFAADQAMYFAKKSGRDVCIGASTLPKVASQAVAS